MTEKKQHFFLAGMKNLKSLWSLWIKHKTKPPKTKCAILRKAWEQEKTQRNIWIKSLILLRLRALEKKATEKDGYKKWLFHADSRSVWRAKKMWRMWANIFDLGLF